jgi:hypothetical protein
VDAGSREENASKQESRAGFRFYRNGKGSSGSGLDRKIALDRKCPRFHLRIRLAPTKADVPDSAELDSHPRRRHGDISLPHQETNKHPIRLAKIHIKNSDNPPMGLRCFVRVLMGRHSRCDIELVKDQNPSEPAPRAVGRPTKAASK